MADTVDLKERLPFGAIPTTTVASRWRSQQITSSGLSAGAAAVSDPVPFIYNNHLHVLVRDGSGKLSDSWFDDGTNHWNQRQINLNELTAGPAAVGKPASLDYNNQLHVLYCDDSGKILDSWYDDATSKWSLQQINLGGLTAGLAAVSDPAALIFNSQAHVLYRDKAGTIWDSWHVEANNQWDLQQINIGGLTTGPAAVSIPVAFVYNDQAHVLYRDATGKVWDSFYDAGTSKWHLQQINLSGLTSGPAAVSDPGSFIFSDQAHVLYRDVAGTIWDSWYDAVASKWHLQQINLSGLTAGPAAVGDPSTYVSNNQAHVLYRDKAGSIWDSWYDRGTSQWHLQQINVSGPNAGPAAASDPASLVYNDQAHVFFRDVSGSISDLWQDGKE